jgi:hypothetical protein
MKNETWESKSWVIMDNYIGHKSDLVISRVNDPLVVLIIKKFFALRYIFMFDAVFFNFGSTLFSPTIEPKSSSLLRNLVANTIYFVNFILQRLELVILKLRNVPIFIQYQGDDARQGSWCRENQSICIANEVDSSYYSPESDLLKIKQILLLQKYCSRIYSLNPDLLNVLPERSSFLPYSHINLDDWELKSRNTILQPLRIGHAPTHRGAKGTQYILNAVENLRNKGFKFDFILIENLDNKSAKEIYQNLDILIDQLLAGWYGGLAVELMAMGKPVIAYIREEDLKFIPIEMKNELQIIKTTPNLIENTLEKILLMDRVDLELLGIRSRKFVERWHNPKIIADSLLKEIENLL